MKTMENGTLWHMTFEQTIEQSQKESKPRLIATKNAFIHIKVSLFFHWILWLQLKATNYSEWPSAKYHLTFFLKAWFFQPLAVLNELSITNGQHQIYVSMRGKNGRIFCLYGVKNLLNLYLLPANFLRGQFRNSGSIEAF